MDCYYTEHVLMRMDARDIEADSVEEVVRRQDIIASYAEDKPYPSYLYLAFVGGRALHVVAAAKGVDSYIIITAYWPEPELWSDDFKKKK